MGEVMGSFRSAIVGSSLMTVVLLLASCSQPVSRGNDLVPTQGPHSLALDIEGDGQGDVRIVPPDVNCADDCSQSYESPVTVSLTVTPAAGSRVDAWGGACAGAGSARQCSIRVEGRISASLVMTADSAPPADEGTGGGGPGGGDQGGDEADETGGGGDGAGGPGDGGGSGDGDDGDGHDGDGDDDDGDGDDGDGDDGDGDDGDGDDGDDRSGPGSDGGDGDDGQEIVNYIFVEPRPSGGTVAGAGLECGDAGGNCERDYEQDDLVELTATASEGYRFVAWTGDCAGSDGNTCSLVMDDFKTVSATFESTE
jgi:hypothetical protein